MHITYAIIFYFLVIVLAFTSFLPLLLFTKVRFKLDAIIQNPLIDTILYFIFAVLIAVLFDSAWTFKELEFYAEFEACIHLVGNSWDKVGLMQKEVCLYLFRKEKEFFIAERNFMLACSACFVWFVFCRYISKIMQIAQNEKLILYKNEAMANAIQKEHINLEHQESEVEENKEVKVAESELSRHAIVDDPNKLKYPFEEACTSSSEVAESL